MLSEVEAHRHAARRLLSEVDFVGRSLLCQAKSEAQLPPFSHSNQQPATSNQQQVTSNFFCFLLPI
jgi:hypothetical protein